MHFQTLASLLAVAGVSSALSDSLPWIVLSTASLGTDANIDQIQTSTTAMKTTKEILAKCPTENYAVVAQSGLHYSALTGSDGLKMASLGRMMNDEKTKGKLVIPEVLGAADGQDIMQYISDVCSKARPTVDAKYLELETQSNDIAASDAVLETQLKTMLESDSVTLIFVGSSEQQAEPTAYEPKFEEPVVMELKRNVEGTLEARDKNGTDWNKLPLFEKYQFFTPGIFMGLFVALVLGSILSVGLKALSSLEVSYGAFDKDMGPAAQKKQQ